MGLERWATSIRTYCNKIRDGTTVEDEGKVGRIETEAWVLNRVGRT